MTVDILPHERILLQARIEEGILENHEAADAMNHAINDGNQWHDNAAYDEAVERMKRIDSVFGPIGRLLADSVEIDYPDPTSHTVCLGSLVAVEQSGDKFHLLLVGQLKTGTQMYEKEWAKECNDDIYVLSPDSPMGGAVFGANVGETIVFEINDKQQTLVVTGVDQTWLQERFSQSSTA